MKRIQFSQVALLQEVESQIQEIVNRETMAWDTQDVDLLMTVWHPDMVFVWPPNPHAHDPIDWSIEWGRYDERRWRDGWQELFDTHELIHNHRTTKRIALSKERDGAFAVVDIDTLWRHRQTGKDFHWKGRVCKVYTKVAGEWKLIMHTGALNYAGQSEET
jgi:ketosteroid isomerase-like protein